MWLRNLITCIHSFFRAILKSSVTAFTGILLDSNLVFKTSHTLIFVTFNPFTWNLNTWTLNLVITVFLDAFYHLLPCHYHVIWATMLCTIKESSKIIILCFCIVYIGCACFSKRHISCSRFWMQNMCKSKHEHCKSLVITRTLMCNLNAGDALVYSASTDSQSSSAGIGVCTLGPFPLTSGGMLSSESELSSEPCPSMLICSSWSMVASTAPLLDRSTHSITS